MAIDALELTRQLVGIASTTYQEEAVGEFLVELLEREEWSVERMEVEQPAVGTPGAGSGRRFNVYAEMSGGAEVVLSTHMDTVPPFVGLREDEEYLYGRGSCDAKGILAAMVAAAERLREDGVKVGMLFVVGEERDSAGARVANERAAGGRYESRFLINGEPTENRLALASKGALRVEMYADGKMGSLGLSGAGGVGYRQAGGGTGSGAGVGAAVCGGDWVFGRQCGVDLGRAGSECDCGSCGGTSADPAGRAG